MKLYTKTGDDGSTGLVGAGRVSKDCLRVEACGAVDELNSALGLAAAACQDQELATILQAIQNRLFELGADLMAPSNPGGPCESGSGENSSLAVPRIGSTHVVEAEQHIDALCDRLPPLDRFILPGGGELAARLHVARTACRRSERRVVALARQESLSSHLVVYLNRLSDLLFAMARRANQLEGVQDVPWTADGGS